MGITMEMPESLPPLPAAVEVAVYRICQEALTNVVRHAKASQCLVELTLAHDEGTGPVVRMEIRDDGRGLPAGLRAGVGLRSMRERAAELGGTCVIEPVLTGGTRVFARLPVATPRAGPLVPETSPELILGAV
jgi:two-component system NarL family sensor kinase